MKAVYRKLHMFDVEVGGRVYRESDLEEPGEEIVVSADRRRRRSWACRSATTCAFPSCTASSPCAARASIALPAAFTLATTRDHWEIAGARARDREPGLRDRRQPDRRAPRRQPLGRALDDRRPVGGRARAGARRARATSSPSSTSSARREIRAQLPALANRRAERLPLARGGARMSASRAERARAGQPAPASAAAGGARRRQAPADPRRGRARVRAPGLSRLPRVGHRRRGRRRLRARLPLLRLQGRGARHAVPRALERDARS